MARVGCLLRCRVNFCGVCSDTMPAPLSLPLPLLRPQRPSLQPAALSAQSSCPAHCLQQSWPPLGATWPPHSHPPLRLRFLQPAGTAAAASVKEQLEQKHETITTTFIYVCLCLVLWVFHSQTHKLSLSKHNFTTVGNVTCLSNQHHPFIPLSALTSPSSLA